MRHVFAAAAVAIAASASTAEAQPRVIEETLVVKDPTVAPTGGTVFGGSVEALYVNAPFESFSTLDQREPFEKGRAKATSLGGNVFGGWSDFTAQFTYRAAHGHSTLTHEPSSFHPERFTHSVEAVPRQEEALLRWLARGLSMDFATPYLYLGYTRLESEFDDIRDSGTWPTTGTAVQHSSIVSKSAIGGIGAILPFSEMWGFRGDVGITRSKQSTDRQGRPHVEGSGTGSRWTGTFYWNFARNWNAQLGARYEYFNGGDAGNMTIAGAFAMLGVTFK